MKKKKEMWDIIIYPTNNVLQDSNYYTKCISEIFKFEPTISYQILKETFKYGKGLVTTVFSKNEAIKTRDKLILFGMKSKIHLS